MNPEDVLGGMSEKAAVKLKTRGEQLQIQECQAMGGVWDASQKKCLMSEGDPNRGLYGK